MGVPNIWHGFLIALFWFSAAHYNTDIYTRAECCPVVMHFTSRI